MACFSMSVTITVSPSSPEHDLRKFALVKLGLVVQSIVSLTQLAVDIHTHKIILPKIVRSFCIAKATKIFSSKMVAI